MWQRFTERTRRVIYYSMREAEARNETEVTPDHLLLGLLCEHGSVALAVLERLHVDLAFVQQEAEARMTPVTGSAKPPRQERVLAARGKKVIDLAYEEARQLNNNYVGTEHLLLGLVREGEGIAARLLPERGANLEAVRREVRNFQADLPSQSGGFWASLLKR